MKTYAALWSIGLVVVVLGFVLSYGLLVFAGFFLGVLGFFAFIRRDQGTAPAADDRH